MTRRNNNAQIRKNVNKEEKIFTIDTVLFLFLVASICVSLITWQSYRINRTDIAISNLESELKEVQMLNDSLEGKLLAKRDLKEVQKIATKKYGMIKPSSSSFVAVDVTDNSDSISSTKSASAQNTKDESALSKLFDSFVSN
ncbi:hypothetical protein [Anaerofustis stercorihominis]|uniref:hypothetical protein n=1 Tax=Anaerofustis stercorihominis TaxID=214853 RepID=UPI00110688DF|nr:hypothetical protein [Anaerofustis stercorihominis]